MKEMMVICLGGSDPSEGTDFHSESLSERSRLT